MELIRGCFDDPELESLLDKAQFFGRLSHDELADALERLFGARLLNPPEFDKIKAIFGKLRPTDPLSGRLLGEFLPLRYHAYLQRRLLQGKSIPAVPYTADHIPATTPKNRRPGLALKPRYLTIHSTGNDGSRATGERNYLASAANPRNASFHVVVDDKQAIECIPLNEVAWHAGDGNGPGNRASVALEICESGDRAKTLANAAAVSARLLKDLGLNASDLRRHNDWAAKTCPRILIDPALRAKPSQSWEWFKAEVERLL